MKKFCRNGGKGLKTSLTTNVDFHKKAVLVDWACGSFQPLLFLNHVTILTDSTTTSRAKARDVCPRFIEPITAFHTETQSNAEFESLVDKVETGF